MTRSVIPNQNCTVLLETQEIRNDVSRDTVLNLHDILHASVDASIYDSVGYELY